MKIMLVIALIAVSSMFASAHDNLKTTNDKNNDSLAFVIDILENAEVCDNPEISIWAIGEFPDTNSIVDYLWVGRVLDTNTKKINYGGGKVAWTSLDSIDYLRVYAKFYKGISQYFKSGSDLIPKLLKLKLDPILKSNIDYFAHNKHSLRVSVVSKRYNDYTYLKQSDKYVSLFLIVNYCINQVYTPANLETIFWLDLENSKLPVEEYFELKYSKFMELYNQYYATDLTEFYIQVCKEFGLLRDHRDHQKTTYTIKEPYKSMNDPDLIKIQEYFNKK